MVALAVIGVAGLVYYFYMSADSIKPVTASPLTPYASIPPRTAVEGPSPYSGITEFDSLSNAELAALVNKRTDELRSFESGYQDRIRQVVSSAVQGGTSEQQHNMFKELSKRKEELEQE
jgi:hypothetical protein